MLNPNALINGGDGKMDIGLIFDNIVGLAGVFLEIGLTVILTVMKVLIGQAITLAIVLPIFLALRIHQRRQERAEAAQGARRNRTKAARAEKNRPLRGTEPRPAPPATQAEGTVMGGGAVRAEPAGFLGDPEAWILRQYPTKGALAVKTLTLLGMLIAGIAAGLMGLLRLWATAAPDLEDEDFIGESGWLDACGVEYSDLSYDVFPMDAMQERGEEEWRNTWK